MEGPLESVPHGAMPADAVPVLWDFAVSIYSREGVKDACLTLQTQAAADVNVIMYCLWLATLGVSLADMPQLLDRCLQISRRWQLNITSPLRASRTSLKEYMEHALDMGVDRAVLGALRQNILDAELVAEKMQLAALAKLVVARAGPNVLSNPAPSYQTRRALAERNLMVYFSAAGVHVDASERACVERILGAAHGE